MPRRHFHGKEVCGGEDLPVPLQELCPAHARLAALWGRLHMVTPQDVTHGQLVDLMAQIRQGTLNATVTPGGVLLGHAQDQLLDVLGDTRSATQSSLLAAVTLLGAQSLDQRRRVSGVAREATSVRRLRPSG